MNAYPAKPLDMDSAADVLGVSRRTLTDALKRLPHYELRGRKKVFYPEHIAQPPSEVAFTRPVADMLKPENDPPSPLP